MLRVRRRKSRFQADEQNPAGLSLQDLEALQSRLNQIQEQINGISLASSQLDMRSLIGLHALGVTLYFLFLPLRWARRIWISLIQNKPFWAAFYWLSFTWVFILDGGLKDVLVSVRHPRHLPGPNDLLQD